MKRNLKTILLGLFLVLVDQFIKVYISKNLMNKEYDIFDNIIAFKPHLNTDYSWVNSFSNMGIGLLPHVIFCVIVLVISLIIFDFIRKRYIDNELIYYLFSLWYAGGLCSLIDKVIWGGSLDYIWLKGFFIFDLKDVYMAIFEIITILSVIINYKKLNKISEKMIYNEFKEYVKKKTYKL